MNLLVRIAWCVVRIHAIRTTHHGVNPLGCKKASLCFSVLLRFDLHMRAGDPRH